MSRSVGGSGGGCWQQMMHRAHIIVLIMMEHLLTLEGQQFMFL